MSQMEDMYASAFCPCYCAFDTVIKIISNLFCSPRRQKESDSTPSGWERFKKSSLQHFQVRNVSWHRYSCFHRWCSKRSVLFFVHRCHFLNYSLVFQHQTREAIPAWDTLLFLYGVLLVPVLFSVLVGINILVWSKSRINYVFIFGWPKPFYFDNKKLTDILVSQSWM